MAKTYVISFSRLKSQTRKTKQTHALADAFDDATILGLDSIPLFFSKSGIILATTLAKSTITKKSDRKILLQQLDRAFAAYLKNKTYDNLVALPPMFEHTMAQAKQQGKRVIIQTTTAHPDYNKALCQKEDIVDNNILDMVATMKRSIAHATDIIATSTFSKQTYAKQKANIHLVHYGVDLQKHKPQKLPKTFTIGMIADFTKLKGLQYLLDAHKNINTKLILMGHMDEYTSALFEQYKIKNPKADIEHRPQGDPREAFRDISVFVFPSMTEGASKVVYEALANGRPVICTKESGSIVKNNKTGFIVPIRNSKQIINKVKFFEKNPAKLKAFSENAKKDIKQYSWQKYTQRVKKAL